MMSKGTFTITCNTCGSNDVEIYVDDVSGSGHEFYCNECKAEGDEIV